MMQKRTLAVDSTLACEDRHGQHMESVRSLGHGMADCSYLVLALRKKDHSSGCKLSGTVHAATLGAAGTAEQRETLE